MCLECSAYRSLRTKKFTRINVVSIRTRCLLEMQTDSFCVSVCICVKSEDEYIDT